MSWPLLSRIPNSHQVNFDSILNGFLDYISFKKLQLYPAQEDAILELFADKNVILNTPTGSGKSLVALALIYQSQAKGRKAIYTCPIKALVSEKFRDLCEAFGPDKVGMITGDGGINQNAPIICCTAEILANMALRDGEQQSFDDIIMDEFHYYSDKQRGVSWQIPLLILKKSRFLLMSATLGEVEFFQKKLTELTKAPTVIVSSTDRPVPLDFEYRETFLHETIAQLISQNLYPIYLVNFSQREAADEAQNLLSVDFSSKVDKQKILEIIKDQPFKSPYGKEFLKLLKHGVGLHHAGLLPRYRATVEKLAQVGLLKVISGTDTLGVGVNVPIRTVLLTKLCKYDGEKTAILTVRDFHQISGRAGRRGFDPRGLVVAQAPEHVIENAKLKLKAAGDPKKQKKMALKKPPTQGFVEWSQDTFKKLYSSQPEQLVSRFTMSHSILLNILNRNEDGCRSLRALINSCHETSTNKSTLRKTAFEYFRSLLERKLIKVVSSPLASGKKIAVNVDLQTDFSLNHNLSLYVLDTIKLLDEKNETYALDLLSLVEAIVENPDFILRKQLDRLKAEKMFELKMQGMDFEERVAELEKLEHPKPNRDFIYSTFNVFSDAHPWVGTENIKPKSVAREMYENFHSFADYIREYDLQRVEGVLLRYLTEVYKILEQTVPEYAKTTEVETLISFFETIVCLTDSSLLDEWQKLKNPLATSIQAPSTTEPKSQSLKSLRIKVVNHVHKIIKELSKKNWDSVLELFEPPNPENDEVWSAEKLEKIFSKYLLEHKSLLADPKSRSSQYTSIEMQKEIWIIDQVLTDPDDFNDWQLRFKFDFKQSEKENRILLKLISFAEI